MKNLFEALALSPEILEKFVRSIPKNVLKVRRIEGKLSIHEHACHIVHVQPMLTQRVHSFINEERPEFAPYVPGTTTPEDELMNLDLDEMLAKFPALRLEFIQLLKDMPQAAWQKDAGHGQFSPYTPEILVRHTLLHDHTHMYRMETLWLAKNL